MRIVVETTPEMSKIIAQELKLSISDELSWGHSTRTGADNDTSMFIYVSGTGKMFQQTILAQLKRMQDGFPHLIRKVGRSFP